MLGQDDICHVVVGIGGRLVASGDDCVYDSGKSFGVPVLARLPPLTHAVVGKEIAHRAFDLIPQLRTQYSFATRVIHAFEIFEETILKRAEAELRNGIEIVERVYTAQVDRGKLAVLVQCLGEISPLNRKSIPRLLTAFLGLLTELDREVNERRNSDGDRSQLTRWL